MDQGLHHAAGGGADGHPHEIPLCRFFNSPRGCRAQQNCQFRHIPGAVVPPRPPLHMLPCRDWQGPGCAYGNRCKFSHNCAGRPAPGAPDAFGHHGGFHGHSPYGSAPMHHHGGFGAPPRPVTICRDWISPEGCKFPRCRFQHSGPGHMSPEAAQAPPRPPCRDFAQGSCRWGDRCRFEHSQGGQGAEAHGQQQ